MGFDMKNIFAALFLLISTASFATEFQRPNMRSLRESLNNMVENFHNINQNPEIDNFIIVVNRVNDSSSERLLYENIISFAYHFNPSLSDERNAAIQIFDSLSLNDFIFMRETDSGLFEVSEFSCLEKIISDLRKFASHAPAA